MAAFPIANMFNFLLAANIVFSLLIVGKVHAVDNYSGLYEYEKSAIPNRTFSDEGKGFYFNWIAAAIIKLSCVLSYE